MLSILYLLRNCRPYSTKSFGRVPLPPNISELSSNEAVTQARRWVDEFASATALMSLREAVEMTFSRSSGPGGQVKYTESNVNKVNTKCTARLSLNADLLPLWSRGSLRKSPAYVHSSNSLLITSSAFRSQAQNIEDCLSKLKKLIVEASVADIVNEPSEQQKARVAGLQKAEKAKQRKEKQFRSALKSSRSKKRNGWD
ncbi:hypothetical protein SCHPADRAFT_386961 [Schizopora paradoxa]|uniref:Prokaryotic-type class I peptide chain release factors domain-containing protein n=1 Tax=Schizopora paradoxa TaxID=27342 RepID=A0A0H2S877_9AGAM|nr:hypothetical protein SCHPADRAFT_386961 [Schizopora paradoxa]